MSPVHVRHVAALVVLALGLSVGVWAKGVVYPEPKLPQVTDKDSFTGTWSRVEPGQRHALWIRKEKGNWQVRLFWMTADGFRLDTNWDERHEFTYKGFKAFIEMKVNKKKSTDDRLHVEFFRESSGARGSLYTERGDLIIERAGFDGRTLIWKIDPLIERVRIAEALTPDEEDSGDIQSKRAWTFQKQSVRQLLWDEIYW